MLPSSSHSAHHAADGASSPLRLLSHAALLRSTAQGSLKLPEMEKLYLEELAIASAAAKGEYTGKPGDGDHKPPAMK